MILCKLFKDVSQINRSRILYNHKAFGKNILMNICYTNAMGGKMVNASKGELLIIGGAEDKIGESLILKEAVGMVGKDDGRISIVTTATNQPEVAGAEYAKLFKKLGVGEIQVLNIDSRDVANEKNTSKTLKNSTGIFFTGGDQLRLTSILGGTSFHQALREFYTSGGVIIGTSAGASVMTNTMIVDGNSNDAARKCTLKMAPGLGLLKEAIIDQHFAQRGRIGRLLCGVAENPEMLGIGIDEDTAIKVLPNGSFRVYGTNSVTVIDGRTIKSSNVSELAPEEILCINNATLHILPVGFGYDLVERKVIRF